MNGTAYDVDTAAKWDEMRQSLSGAAVAELTLRDCAKAVGVGWPYLRGDKPLKFFLAMDGDSLRGLRGFGLSETAELPEIVCGLARKSQGR
jgi:hypothetical protein